MTDVTDTGIVTTAGDMLFTGGREGYLQALDARTGTLLWKTNLGAQMLNNPITYMVNGRQYVTAMAGLSLFAFALPNRAAGYSTVTRVPLGSSCRDRCSMRWSIRLRMPFRNSTRELRKWSQVASVQ